MAEVSQRPEPGSGRWGFLHRLPNKLAKRGELPKPAVPTAEELRRQEREDKSS